MEWDQITFIYQQNDIMVLHILTFILEFSVQELLYYTRISESIKKTQHVPSGNNINFTFWTLNNWVCRFAKLGLGFLLLKAQLSRHPSARLLSAQHLELNQKVPGIIPLQHNERYAHTVRGEKSIWNQKRWVSACETVNCPDSLFPGNYMIQFPDKYILKEVLTSSAQKWRQT